jgi:hypothetical protein
MVIATFREGTPNENRTIEWEHGRLFVPDVHQVYVRDVIAFDDAGHIEWAYDGLREWVRQPYEIPLKGSGKAALVDLDAMLAVGQFIWEPMEIYAVTRRRRDGRALGYCDECGRLWLRDPADGYRSTKCCLLCGCDKRRRKSPILPGTVWGDAYPMHKQTIRSSEHLFFGVGRRIHHCNANGLDNRAQNLVSLHKRDHDALHAAAKEGHESYQAIPTPLGVERHGYPIVVSLTEPLEESEDYSDLWGMS